MIAVDRTDEGDTCHHCGKPCGPDGWCFQVHGGTDYAAVIELCNPCGFELNCAWSLCRDRKR
jgi:hypothetical protein